MTENDRLRELLELVAPHDPDLPTAERSAAVVRRGRAARRRARALTGAAVVAVLAAALAVPLALRGDDTDADRAAERPDELPAAYTAPACPAEPADIGTGSADLPAGATSVRLCPGASGGSGPVTWTPQRTALVGAQVDAFLAEVVDLAPYRPEPLCATASVVLQPWTLQVTYPDRVVRVGAGSRICAALRLGGREVGAAQVTGLFFDHQTEQRTGRYGPEVPQIEVDPPACADPVPDTWDGFGNVSANARAGRVCLDDGSEALLTDGQAAALAEEIHTATTDSPTDPLECGVVEPTRLRLVDPWGDVVTWTQTSCGGEMSSAEGYWMPSDGARAILDDAVTR